MSNPVTNPNLRIAATAGFDEIVRLLVSQVGPLGPIYRDKAETFAKVAAISIEGYVRGEITAEQLDECRKNLQLAARSIVAEVGIDVFGRRKAMAEGLVAVLFKALVALATA